MRFNSSRCSTPFDNHDFILLAVSPAVRRIRRRNVVTRNHRAKARLQSVVVFLQNRIELMVVTAGTTDAQPQKYFTRNIGHLIQNILPLRASISLVVFVQVGTKEILWRPELPLCQEPLRHPRAVR